jgi:F420-0:gamma-glutamyl ligase
MRVRPIRSQKVRAGDIDLLSLLDNSLAHFSNKSILVVTSKIVSLCENRVVPIGSVDLNDLIAQEAQLYTDGIGKYSSRFTITNNTLIPIAGIDESNGDGNYILWPKDPQQTANKVRAYLIKRFSIKYAGVIISDSTSRPLRLGTTGIALACSGFKALNRYTGTEDLFHRPLVKTEANIAEGLAAAAVVTMGEGDEQTPLCVVENVPFVQFQDRDPSPKELQYTRVKVEDDLYEPFLKNIPWKQGKGGNSSLL